MDELKHRAGEKLEALHDAAVTAAGNGKSRVQDVVNQTWETLLNIRNTLSDLWNDELIAEGRARVAAWSRETLQRVRDGAPPLSPMVLYEELLALFHDRVWRRSVLIFCCGAALGGGVGLAAGLRVSARQAGPWDAALTCSSAVIPAGCRCNTNAILKATVPRWAHLDLRPTALITDRLPTPLYIVFAAAFYVYRVLRCISGCGAPEWAAGAGAGLRTRLRTLAALVDSGALAPVLDKVYLPQDFESALAHACSEDALGTTVIRFP